jgi:hypothetical protein
VPPAHRVVQFKLTPQTPAHAVQVRVARRATPLVRQVVDDQDGARVRELAVGPVVVFQVHWQQRGVPVVGDKAQIVLAVGHPTTRHAARGLNGGLREEGAAKGHVHAVAAVDVSARPAVVARVVDKHPVDAICITMEEPDLHVCVEDVQADAHARLPSLGVFRVARGDSHDPVPAPGEGFGQGGHHIAQPARFRPGRAFGGDKDQIHRVFARSGRRGWSCWRGGGRGRRCGFCGRRRRRGSGRRRLLGRARARKRLRPARHRARAGALGLLVQLGDEGGLQALALLDLGRECGKGNG